MDIWRIGYSLSVFFKGNRPAFGGFYGFRSFGVKKSVPPAGRFGVIRMIGLSEWQSVARLSLWCRLRLVIELRWLEVCDVILHALHLLVSLAGHLDVVGVSLVGCLLSCRHINADELVHRTILEGYFLHKLWMLTDDVAEGGEVDLTVEVGLFHCYKYCFESGEASELVKKSCQTLKFPCPRLARFVVIVYLCIANY